MLKWYIAIQSSDWSTDGHKYGPFIDFNACHDWFDRNPYIKSGYKWVIFSERFEEKRGKTNA